MTYLQEMMGGPFVKKILPTLKLQYVCVVVGGGEFLVHCSGSWK